MGSKGSQDVTTRSEPWTNRGRLVRLSQKAERQFEGDKNPWRPNVYQGDWVAPISDYTRQAQEAMTKVYRPDQIGRIYGGMRDNTNTFQRGAQQLARTGGGMGPTRQYLGRTMRDGGMSGSEDMYGRMMSQDSVYRDLDAMKASALEDAQAQMNSQFGGGLMGGGLMAQEYGRGMADAALQAEYDAYNTAMNRALQAGGQMDAAYNASRGRELQSAGMLGGQFDNMMSRQMAGLNMLPQYNDMMRTDYDWRSGNLDNQANAYLRAGSIDESYAQRLADAERAKFDAMDATGRTGMQNYANFLLGIGGAGSVGTQSGGGPSPIAQGLGGVATGLGTYGALAMNPVTAPYAALGGIATGLGSIF